MADTAKATEVVPGQLSIYDYLDPEERERATLEAERAMGEREREELYRARAERLSGIEEQIEEITLDAKNSAWSQLYDLMKTVQGERLYAPKHKSFTAWLRAQAAAAGLQESTYWAKIAAGRLYDAWARDRIEQDRPVVPIEEIGVSYDNLSSVATIVGGPDGDMWRADELIQQLRAGELDTKGLREEKRLARRGAKPRQRREGDGGDKAITDAVTKAVVEEARDGWIWGDESEDERSRRLELNRHRDYIRRRNSTCASLKEFPVRVPGVQRPRRIDVLTVENETEDDWMQVALRAVEVKVSEHDLERDHKLGDGRLFCDYVYLAVPENLVAMAMELRGPGVGVLSWAREGHVGADGMLTDRHIKVVQEPERVPDPPQRAQALATAVVKVAHMGPGAMKGQGESAEGGPVLDAGDAQSERDSAAN